MGSTQRCRDGHRSWVLSAVALVALPFWSLTDQPPTGTPEPYAPSAPGTLAPPEEAPGEEVLGGSELASVGVPLADPSAPAPPAVDAAAWLIAEAESGDVLAAFSPHEPRPPASTIKLLTAIATGPVLDPEETYVATDADASVEGSRVGLVSSQSYTVNDLMHGLMLASGNDAAHALAEAAGGQDATVDLMNDEARQLGAFDTHAVTPHGLDSPDQLSSAYDLALIGRRALNDEQVARLAGTRTYDFPGLDGEVFQIQNQNRLLGQYDGAIGLKTGYTTLAGHTIVGVAERDGRTLIAAVLGSDRRAEDGAAALFDWAFQAGEIEPVGHLVTPDEVSAMVDDAAQAADDGEAVGENPLGDYEDVFGSTDGSSDGVPKVVWISLAAAALAGGVGFAVRRRNPKSSNGRYASRR